MSYLSEAETEGAEAIYARWKAQQAATPAQKAQVAADQASAAQRVVVTVTDPREVAGGAEETYERWKAMPPATPAQKAQVAADVAAAEPRVVYRAPTQQVVKAGFPWQAIAVFGGMALAGFLLWPKKKGKRK